MGTFKIWAFPISVFKAKQQALSIRTKEYELMLTTQFLKTEISRPAPEYNQTSV